MPSAHAVRAGQAYVELSARYALLNEQLKKGLQKFKAFGEQAANLARVNIIATITATVPIAKITNDYAQFDDKMRTVQATTKATGKDFEELTELARKLGRTTSFTAQQAADGMVALGRAGFSSTDIQSVMKNFLNLSRATATELPRSIEIASSVLRGFNLDVSESQRVVDVLTVAANGSAQTLDDLGDSFKYISPLARETGMSVEAAAKAVAFLANMGIKGSLAATAMRNILVRMSTSDVQAKYRELGVEVVDKETGQLRKFADVMKDLNTAIQDLPSGQKLGIFRELFGLFGLAGGASFMADVDFSKVFDAIDNAEGEAERIAKQMDAGIGGRIRLTWSEVKDAFLEIGKTLTPAITEVLSKVKRYADELKFFINDNKEAFEGVIKLATGFAEMTIQLAEMISKFAMSHPTIAKLVVAFVGLSPVLFAMGMAIKTLCSVFLILQAAFNATIPTLNNLLNRISGLSAAKVELARATQIANAAATAEMTASERLAKLRLAEAAALIRLRTISSLYQQQIQANNAAIQAKLTAEQKVAAATARIAAAQQAVSATLIQRTQAENALNQQLKINQAYLNQVPAAMRAAMLAQTQQLRADKAAAVQAHLRAKADLNAANTANRRALAALQVANADIQATTASRTKLLAELQSAGAAAKKAQADVVAAAMAKKDAAAEYQDALATEQAAMAKVKKTQSMKGLMAAMMAVGAVYSAVASIIAFYNRVSEQQTRIADKGIEVADRQEQAMQKRHQTDNELFARLKELSEVQNKTDAEMKEATNIVDTLSKSYNGLGLSIDAATGKIEGLDAAQKKMLAQQAEREISAKKAKINALKSKNDALDAKWKKFDNSWFERYRVKYNAWNNGGPGTEEYINDIYDAKRVNSAEIRQLESELKILENQRDQYKEKGGGDAPPSFQALANAAAQARKEAEEAMFGKADPKRSARELFDEYAKNLDSEYYNRYVDLEKKKGVLDKYIMSQDEFEKRWGSKRSETRERNSRIPLLNELQGRFERGENWLAEQNRQETNNKKLYDQNKELGSAYEVLAKAISDNNTQAITEAQKQVEEAKKKTNEKALEVAMDNYKASQDAANVALRAYEEAKAASDTLPEQLNLLREEMLQARANEMEMNSALASAVSAAGKDMDDSLSGISPMGTFGRLEFLDRGGSNALLEEAKQQKELLRTLDFSVKRIAGTLSDTGEFV